MDLVTCKELSKFYQDGDATVHALDNIALTVAEGEFLSLSGPSGSGKTTLLNLIGALDTPTSGTIVCCGAELQSLSRAQKTTLRLTQLGFIFQSYNLIPVLSAQENVEFCMQLQGLPAAERASRAREALQRVGLSGLEKRRPGELSGGQQQRVAVARAIASQPRLILADEPTANLDSHTAESLLDLMADMNRDLGITFIFSTHDRLVMDYAHRIVQLRDGRIVEEETRPL
jgi:putative ABC transport system ATP-binding protein